MTLIELLDDVSRQSLEKRTFKKGEILFHEDEDCRGLALLKTGKIKIVSYSLGGNEVILNLIEEGGMFGHNLVWSSSPKYRGDCVALTSGEMIFIEKEKLLDLFALNRAFLEEYLRLASDFSKQLNLKVKILSFPTAKERLYYLARKRGYALSFHSVKSLAEELFLARESLSRLLHSLEDEGKIRINEHEILFLEEKRTF